MYFSHLRASMASQWEKGSILIKREILTWCTAFLGCCNGYMLTWEARVTISSPSGSKNCYLEIITDEPVLELHLIIKFNCQFYYNDCRTVAGPILI